MDATFVKTRQDHRVVSMAVVIAVGLNAATGQREILGVDVGPSEDGAFWLRFLRSLVARGLQGVQLVTSDALGDSTFTFNGTHAAQSAFRFEA